MGGFGHDAARLCQACDIPEPTGSVTCANTIGTVRVACRKVTTDVVALAKMTFRF